MKTSGYPCQWRMAERVTIDKEVPGLLMIKKAWLAYSSQPKIRIARVVLISMLIAITIYVNRNSSLQWPALDNFPGICGALAECNNSNDLLSYKESSITLRWPFQALMIFIAKLAGGSPYAPFSIIKGFILVAYPASIFLLAESFCIQTTNIKKRQSPVVTGKGKQFQPKEGQGLDVNRKQEYERIGKSDIRQAASLASAFLISLLICGSNILWKASAAWWMSPFFNPAPGWLSQAIVFLAITLTASYHERDRRLEIIVIGSAITAATLIHPIASLFSLVFGLTVAYRPIRMIALQLPFWALGYLASTAFIKIRDSGISNISVTNEEFQRIYVDMFHSKHYSVLNFGHINPFRSWIEAALLTTGIIVILTLTIYIWTKNRDFLARSTVILGLYLGAIGLQYLSNIGVGGKLIAALGPSRFMMYGPLFAVILIGPMLTIVATVKTKRNFSIQAAGIIAPLIPVLVLIKFFSAESNPVRGISNNQAELVRWIKANTGSGDMIAVSRASGLSVIVSTFAKRPVMSGHGFPFSEKLFDAYEQRFALNVAIFDYMNDNYSDNWSGYDESIKLISPRYSIYLRNPKQSLTQSSKEVGVKWLVGTSSLSSPVTCKGVRPAFENKEFRIFKAEDLIHCTK